MLEKIEEVEKKLPELLKDEKGWNSLLVDYHHPHVWRLWRQFDDEHRVLLHKIFPCETGDALLHPHPWPSAVKIFTPGPRGYETGVGWASPEAADVPPVAAKFLLCTASEYEMTDPRAWHYVRPVKRPVLSVMVIGKPFGGRKQERFGQEREHKQLDDAQRAELFNVFRNRYKPW